MEQEKSTPISQDKDASSTGSYLRGEPAQCIEHRGISEELRMNKYHILLLVERLLRRNKIPDYTDILPWLGVLFAVLLPLVAADFHDFLGLSKEAWKAFCFMAAIVSGVIMIYVFIKAYVCRKEKCKTSEDIVEDIINKMSEEREKLSKMSPTS
jgi:hypothetical protein